ncbi:hypothetical protein D9758_005819 [Tetrapyrgos nigripes]|uniref:DEAD/DEAH-box helicase domain-containing protein n=1 Tax=Tetrapyrgos nigripes TaxID=182062 RepID=A0A8H5GJC3_9AGAR|nr:hypothetical protein D9758_005819 [Tetrapyrgos nigripes]
MSNSYLWHDTDGYNTLKSIVSRCIPQWPSGLRDYQAQYLPLLLDKGDILLVTATGDGKSTFFIVPILAHLEIRSHPDLYLSQFTCNVKEHPVGIVITPTKGLAASIPIATAKCAGVYAKMHKTCFNEARALFGGLPHPARLPRSVIDEEAALMEALADAEEDERLDDDHLLGSWNQMLADVDVNAADLPVAQLAIIFLLITTPLPTALASTNFVQCLADLKQNYSSLDGGRDNQGRPVSMSRATAVSYELCVEHCGSGPEAFSWAVFSQAFSSWLLPWFALISQLPFGAHDKLDNFTSMLLAVGSPTLAAYSVMITVLNSRWLTRRFNSLSYPNAQTAIRVLSSLQQAPIRVNRLHHELLPSLIVLPENDQWWETLNDHLDYAHTWSVSAATNIAWTLLAYIFTIIDSFTADLSTSQLVHNTGQSVGSLWLWLLPIVFAWLQISPKCDSMRVYKAMKRANDVAYSATDNPDIKAVLASSRGSDRAMDLQVEDHALNADERCTAPIFNYSRLFSWAAVVEEVESCLQVAAQRAAHFEPVNKEIKWVEGERSRSIQDVNRRGTALQVQNYCRYFPGPEPRRCSSAVWSRIFIASFMALFLQWGTTGAGLMTIFLTPTRGLGCRSTSYLIYASLSAVVWALFLLSSILSHHSSPGIDLDHGNGRHRRFRSSIAAQLSISFRRLGKTIATINAVGITVSSIFQISGFYDRCYCNASVISHGVTRAFTVIILEGSEISSMRNVWIGGTVLALGSAAMFILVLNLLINPSPPEAS